jgi:hypothetical protein
MIALEVARLKAAAGQLGHARFVESLHLAADELCLFVFEADGPDEVTALSLLAAVQVDRIRTADLTI